MFIGHYALGLAAKRVAPRASPVFLLLGWERVRVSGGGNPFLTLTFDAYPVSHSLLALVGWGILLALLYRWRTGDARTATLVGLLVVSHWVLDFVTHVPDMPLYPGGPKVGLGLWNSVTGTVVIEGLMFVAGAWVYLTTTRARDAVGRYALWALLAFLGVSYIASLFTGPPPTLQAIELGGIVFGWLFVGWAAWADRHREGIA